MGILTSLTALPVAPRLAFTTLVSKTLRTYPRASLFIHPAVAGRCSTVRFQGTAALDMANVNTTERLTELRRLMKDRKIDVYSRLANMQTSSTARSLVADIAISSRPL